MPAVVFAMNTGLRGGELGGMDRSDINFEARMLTVHQEHAKNGKQRHVPLKIEAMAMLKRWMSQTGNSGRVFGVDGLKSAWTSLLGAAKIGDSRFHIYATTAPASWS